MCRSMVWMTFAMPPRSKCKATASRSADEVMDSASAAPIAALMAARSYPLLHAQTHATTMVSSQENGKFIAPQGAGRQMGRTTESSHDNTRFARRGCSSFNTIIRVAQM